jgi:hypothetical protein
MTATLTLAPVIARKASKVEVKAPKGLSLRQKLALAFAAKVGVVAVGATALSLSDLAETFQDVAHVAVWKSYALAAALDLNFISTEGFSLFATAAAARATHKATLATKVITLTMSAAANAYAMSRHANTEVEAAADIAFGIAIPALLALATYTLGKAVGAK